MLPSLLDWDDFPLSSTSPDAKPELDRESAVFDDKTPSSSLLWGHRKLTTKKQLHNSSGLIMLNYQL